MKDSKITNIKRQIQAKKSKLLKLESDLASVYDNLKKNPTLINKVNYDLLKADILSIKSEIIILENELQKKSEIENSNQQKQKD